MGGALGKKCVEMDLAVFLNCRDACRYRMDVVLGKKCVEMDLFLID